MATGIEVIDRYRDLGASLDRGFTIPAEWYTSVELFEFEKKRIFHRFWQYAGYLEQVREAGAYFTRMVGDIPIVVVRDGEGMLHAYANVCRHRGSTLVLESAGCRKSIQCHYHGWVWNLDGTLRSAPRWNEEPDFQKADFPLVALAVETWGPMIFVNPDREAAPLSATLGLLPGIVAASGLRFDDLRFRVSRRYEIAANWKIVVENYNECYHCPIAHPAFSAIMDIDAYRVITAYEYFNIHRAPLTESAKSGGRTAYDVSEAALATGVREGTFGFIWPNSTYDINPGAANLVVGYYVPLAVDRTLAVMDCFFAESVEDETSRAIIDFANQVQLEDIVLCESVQRGMRSGYFEQGRLLKARENGIQHFQALLYRVLTG